MAKKIQRADELEETPRRPRSSISKEAREDKRLRFLISVHGERKGRERFEEGKTT